MEFPIGQRPVDTTSFETPKNGLKTTKRGSFRTGEGTEHSVVDTAKTSNVQSGSTIRIKTLFQKDVRLNAETPAMQLSPEAKSLIDRAQINHGKSVLMNGMRSTIAQLSSIQTEETRAAIPTSDFSRFLDFLTVECSQELSTQHDISHISHGPKEYIQLRNDINALLEQANTIEEESHENGIPKEKADQLQKTIANLRAQANEMALLEMNSRKTHACEVLLSLAESSDETAVMQEMIKDIDDKVEGGINLNNALDLVLSENIDRLPRNLLYLLMAGGQRVCVPIQESFMSAIPDALQGDLISSAQGDRTVKVNMHKSTDGAVSHILISQQMQMVVKSASSMMSGADPKVLSASILQQTDIQVKSSIRREAVNSVILIKPPVVTGANPAHINIANKVESIFSGVSTDATVI
jgi:hypothetical protein